MAQINKIQVGVKLTVLLELDEAEVKALDGIFGYDVNQFLKVFYERMGKAYVEPHEQGVRSLHKTIRGIMSVPIRLINDSREAINKILHP